MGIADSYTFIRQVGYFSGFFFGFFFRRFFIDVVSLTLTMKGLGLLFVVVMVNSGDKPYLIEDGTCNEINHRPCCKRLIELYEKNLESQNRFEYPKCRPDGYYESKQCTDERETPTGWLADCTCVDENGKELLKLDDSYALCPIKAENEDTSKTDNKIRTINEGGATHEGVVTPAIEKEPNELPNVEKTDKEDTGDVHNWSAEMQKWSAEMQKWSAEMRKNATIQSKPNLIYDGTCIKISDRPCCKQLIDQYKMNLESQNQYEYEYPECRHDGYYKSKQCTNFRPFSTGHDADCKCVDENGDVLKLKYDDDCPADKERQMKEEERQMKKEKGMQMQMKPSPKSAIQQLGQRMLTWMKTTIETLMKLELELEHGAHGPSKPSWS